MVVCPSLSLKYVSAVNVAPQRLWPVLVAREVIVRSLTLLMGTHFFDLAVAKVIKLSLLSAGGVTLNNSFCAHAIVLAKLSSFPSVPSCAFAGVILVICPSLSLKYVSAANVAPWRLWSVMVAGKVIVRSVALLIGTHFFDLAVAKVIKSLLLSARGVTLNNSFHAHAIILVGAALEKSLRKQYFQNHFFQCNLVDMVCRMNIHQDGF